MKDFIDWIKGNHGLRPPHNVRAFDHPDNYFGYNSWPIYYRFNSLFPRNRQFPNRKRCDSYPRKTMSDQFLDRAQRLHAAIKQELLKNWDPIGVKDIPEAQDEYDSYVPKIYKMLIQRKTKQEIFDYLWWIETEHMGLSGNRQSTDACADRLLSLIQDE